MPFAGLVHLALWHKGRSPHTANLPACTNRILSAVRLHSAGLLEKGGPSAKYVDLVAYHLADQPENAARSSAAKVVGLLQLALAGELEVTERSRKVMVVELSRMTNAETV